MSQFGWETPTVMILSIRATANARFYFPDAMTEGMVIFTAPPRCASNTPSGSSPSPHVGGDRSSSSHRTWECPAVTVIGVCG
jgi:hypothetical protein